jgi:hypothetical protein
VGVGAVVLMRDSSSGRWQYRRQRSVSLREDLHTCYTIVKLKCIRKVLRFVMGLHVRHELRKKEKDGEL